LNVHSVSDVRQLKIHTAEPLVTQSSPFETGIAIAKLRRCRSPDIHQMAVELILAGDERLHSEIYKFINSIWNKEELPHQWKKPIIVPTYKMGDKIVVIIEADHCYQLHTKYYKTYFIQGEVHM
jgi:hypothetical protein